MSFRKKRFIRKPISTTQSSSEEEDSIPLKPNKSNPIKTPSTQLSFEQQDDDEKNVQESTLHIKMKRNQTSLNQRLSSTHIKESPSYSQGHLQELKANQSVFVEDKDSQELNIPDSKTIEHLKKKREEKRLNAKKQVVFVPLDSRISESRLVNEDQEIDGEEAFEDYTGKTITFGSNAVIEAEKERKIAMEMDLFET